MKLLFSSLVLTVVMGTSLQAQNIRNIDTLVPVGRNRLHFVVTGGKGIPIIFEAGGGNDGSTWENILSSISYITGAPLITYDRPGFGLSTLDSGNHDIVSTVKALEDGLNQLGYKGPLMLVAHSLGAFYATIYTFRNPHKVKAAVFIDGNLIEFFTERQKAGRGEIDDAEAEKWRNRNPGIYYIYKDFSNTLSAIRNAPFPAALPVTDIVAEKTPFQEAPDSLLWRKAHERFVAAGSKRKAIVAFGSGHFVHKDNPALTIDAIALQYALLVSPSEREKLYERAIIYSLRIFNEAKKKDSSTR